MFEFALCIILNRYAFVSFRFWLVPGGSWHFLKRCGQFVSCSATFAIYKSYGTEFRNALKNDVQNHQNSCIIYPKSTKMMPRSAPKATLGARWIEVAKKGATAFHKIQIFGAIWAILGAILDPAGRQGGPKIELFGTKSHQNLKKWDPKWGIKKYTKFWSKS